MTNLGPQRFLLRRKARCCGDHPDPARAKLPDERQFAGCRVKLPVQLGRRPLEPADGGLQTFYQKLLKAVNSKAFREGEWRLCERSGWPDNQSYKNLVAWCRCRKTSDT